MARGLLGRSAVVDDPDLGEMSARKKYLVELDVVVDRVGM
jgi:hypothetical protein